MEKKARPSSLRGKLSRDVFFGTSPDIPKIIEIDLDQLTSNPDQPRKTFNQEALQELALSIEKHGLIQPVTVKKNLQGDGYILVAGERRYRAHRLLEKPAIYAIVTEGSADEIALIENIQREDLNPLETAEAMAQMVERHHYKQEELGRVIGKAQATISEFLKLNSLPEAIKSEYRTSDTLPKAVSKSVLIEITRLKSLDEQLAFWGAAKQGQVTVKMARARKTASAPRPIKPVTEQSLSAGRKFARTLESLDPKDFKGDEETYRQLRELHQHINGLLEGLLSQERMIRVKAD